MPSIEYEKIRDHVWGVGVELYPPIPPSYPCDYCGQTFASQEALQDHIRATHKAAPPSVRVNEKVVDGDAMFEEVESIRLYTNGHDVWVRLQIDGREKMTMQCSGSQHRVDLLEAHQAVGCSIFELAVDSQKYTITQRKIEDVKNCEILKRIESMRQGLAENIPVDWRNLSDTHKICGENADEHRFFEGFYEYYYSCTVKGRERENPLLRAFAKLYPFSKCSPVANQALAIICLHFNWIGRLGRICNENTPYCFQAAYAFLTALNNVGRTANLDQYYGNVDIYVDPDEYDNVQAMLSFNNEDMQAVQTYLNCNLSRAGGKEIAQNLADKIFLLKARYALKTGADAKEIKYYYSLVSGEFYQAEKEKFHVK